MTCSAVSLPAPVIFASPVSQPPSERHSSSSSGPAARWIAPSTPPPPRRLEFAALTIASASPSVVMSPWCSVISATPHSVPPVKLGVERSKRLAHMGLAAIGAHGAVLRARDRVRARRALRHDPHVAGPDGRALPPDELIAQVSGIRDAEQFIAGGAL